MALTDSRRCRKGLELWRLLACRVGAVQLGCVCSGGDLLGDLGYWLCVEVHLSLQPSLQELRAEDKGAGIQDRCCYGRISAISLRFKVMS